MRIWLECWFGLDVSGVYILNKWEVVEGMGGCVYHA